MWSPSIFPYSLLFTFSLLFTLHFATPTLTGKPSDDLIIQTCQKCTQMASFNFTDDFCFNSLATIPVSHVTNLAGLGLVAMELTLENATNTLSIITAMLNKNSSKPSSCESCLHSCLELYSDMSSVLEECVGEFLSSQYDPVYFWVSAIMQATSICEGGFQGKGEQSPLSKENGSLSQLCGIVLCIIELLNPHLRSRSS